MEKLIFVKCVLSEFPTKPNAANERIRRNNIKRGTGVLITLTIIKGWVSKVTKT